MVTLQQSKEVDGTGLRLKCSLEAEHSPLLTVSWRGEIGWEECREAVQQPRGGVLPDSAMLLMQTLWLPAPDWGCLTDKQFPDYQLQN